METKTKRKLTSIQVTQEFKDYLTTLGKKGQSYENLLKELIGKK